MSPHAAATAMEATFDLELGIARKLRALRRGDPDARFLMRRAAEDLADRLAAVSKTFGEAAALYSVTPDAAATVAESGKAGHVIRVEADRRLLAGETGLAGPGERLPLPEAGIDLAVSLMSLHEANDLPGLLLQIRCALRPDGLFLAALAGHGTLAELRESLLAAETELSGGAGPRVFPFADVRTAGALLQRAGFALPVADVETVTVRYDSMFHLMRDLRAMGATSSLAARPRRPATRALFARAAEIYAERFSDPDGRVRASFAFLWLSGWAPHSSQQKPLEPGSGRVPLARALKDGLRQRGGSVAGKG